MRSIKRRLICAVALTLPLTGCGERPFGKKSRAESAAPTTSENSNFKTMATDGAPSPRSVQFTTMPGVVKRLLVFGDARTTALDGGIYDPTTNKWTQIPAAPVGLAIDGATVADFGDRLVLWGGNVKEHEPTNHGAVFDAATNEWHALSLDEAPSPRWDHASYIWRDKLVVFGGHEAKALDGGVYDPGRNAWEPIPGLAPPADGEVVEHSSIALVDDSLCALYRREREKLSLHCFDLVARSWREIEAAAIEPGLELFSIDAVGHSLVIWGGARIEEGGAKARDGGYAYDFASQTWRTLSGLTVTDAQDLAPMQWVQPFADGQHFLVQRLKRNGFKNSPPTLFDLATGSAKLVESSIDETFGPTQWFTVEGKLVEIGWTREKKFVAGVYDPSTEKSWRLPVGDLAYRNNFISQVIGQQILLWGGWDGEKAVGDGAVLTVTDAGAPGANAPVAAKKPKRHGGHL